MTWQEEKPRNSIYRSKRIHTHMSWLKKRDECLKKKKKNNAVPSVMLLATNWAERPNLGPAVLLCSGSRQPLTQPLFGSWLANFHLCLFSLMEHLLYNLAKITCLVLVYIGSTHIFLSRCKLNNNKDKIVKIKCPIFKIFINSCKRL